MRALTLRIKNDHNRQAPRLRVMVAEDGLHRDVLRPPADDGQALVHVGEYLIGGHRVTVELKITAGALVGAKP